MTPGYSKLLLSEFVLPTRDCPLYPALLDINMMGEFPFSNFGGFNRFIYGFLVCSYAVCHDVLSINFLP